ncbi:hypothetical protein BJV78DRAFT_1356241 [Lactifluus subvellereus]|nr:hypothetical protein BJV78DRAFT_1356241 [Lactifluus subvellereus]
MEQQLKKGVRTKVDWTAGTGNGRYEDEWIGKECKARTITVKCFCPAWWWPEGRIRILYCILSILVKQLGLYGSLFPDSVGAPKGARDETRARDHGWPTPRGGAWIYGSGQIGQELVKKTKVNGVSGRPWSGVSHNNCVVAFRHRPQLIERLIDHDAVT